MSYEAEGNAIQDRFNGQWVTDDSPPAALTPIDWENVPFKKPGQDGVALGPWVRVRVHGSDAAPTSIGGPTVRYDHDGDVVVEIFVPQNTGPVKARQLADAACQVFRAWDDAATGIQFWAPRMVSVEASDGWHRKNVIAPFRRTEAFAHQ